MSHIARWSRHHRRSAVRLAVPMAFVALLGGCSDDDNAPRRTPTPTTAAAPTSTATAPAATATAPPASATATAPATTPTAAPPTPTPPNTNARTACQKLTACGQCFADQNGQCLGTDTCAGRLSADVAACINGAAGCDAVSLGDCLFLGCDGADASGECQ